MAKIKKAQKGTIVSKGGKYVVTNVPPEGYHTGEMTGRLYKDSDKYNEHPIDPKSIKKAPSNKKATVVPKKKAGGKITKACGGGKMKKK